MRKKLNYTRLLQVWLTPELYQQIETLAVRRGQTLSDLMREHLRDLVEREGAPSIPAQSAQAEPERALAR